MQNNQEIQQLTAEKEKLEAKLRLQMDIAELKKKLEEAPSNKEAQPMKIKELEDTVSALKAEMALLKERSLTLQGVKELPPFKLTPVDIKTVVPNYQKVYDIKELSLNKSEINNKFKEFKLKDDKKLFYHRSSDLSCWAKKALLFYSSYDDERCLRTVNAGTPSAPTVFRDQLLNMDRYQQSFFLDERHLVVSEKHYVHVYDTQTNKTKQLSITCGCGNSGITFIAPHGTQKILVAYHNHGNNFIKQFSINPDLTLSLIKSWGFNMKIIKMVSSPDGKKIAVFGDQNSYNYLEVWEFSQLQTDNELKNKCPKYVYSMHFTPNSKHLICQNNRDLLTYSQGKMETCNVGVSIKDITILDNQTVMVLTTNSDLKAFQIEGGQ